MWRLYVPHVTTRVNAPDDILMDSAVAAGLTVVINNQGHRLLAAAKRNIQNEKWLKLGPVVFEIWVRSLRTDRQIHGHIHHNTGLP